ncbi:MAG: 50S ribosomal protein L24 [Halobacteriovoraceae bacterium]|nr:50S ribosomal protein L24 [Halobacteriovoraceae bacterium]
MKKLKVGDEVIITAGKDKGKKGKLKLINYKRNVVFVEGLNLVKKAVKPDQSNPNGGFVTIEAALDYSNVMAFSEKLGKASRVGIRTNGADKTRFLKACGTELK